ncbi:Uncharacterized protein ALO80_02847 [Pseudomonas caricapapayae]|uniref:hypothetical protein n=1 Tax=Pseudomonas caricapapayae TaxID=46678 RepID=UPI0006D5CF58|nr:hypothetical protein [Pseudomonas caricapapayae]KAA8686779.1 hypothetical protein F4W67_29245 [Pseudomonas caricapapayae]KPW61429.1 Uncharacterized protein ALO80_02847 [Pseudomonas caricapapayae]RMV97379.1 hypothetical protein ALP01_200477 [Pseudomonas caricapapayae]
MAKKVTVKSGTVYTTPGAAQAYFGALREGTAIDGKLSDPDRSDVLDIYRSTQSAAISSPFAVANRAGSARAQRAASAIWGNEPDISE